MNEKEIQEYEELEWSVITEIKNRLGARTDATFREWFPELQLRPPYTSLNLHPFWIGLPYYRTLIFHVYPFESEEILQRAHGVTVANLLALRDEGKVQFILAGPPSAYRGLDYLNPILRTRPPAYSFRNAVFFMETNGAETWKEWHDEGKAVFLSKLDSLRKKLGVSTPTPAFEGSVIGAWLNLRGMGLHSLAEAIKEVSLHNVESAAIYLEVYHDLLCAPRISALGGCATSNAHYLSIAASVASSVGAELPPTHQDYAGGFPIEAGRLLAERYHLVRPRTLSEAIEIYPDYGEARAALQSLADYVRVGRVDLVVDAAGAVSRAFEEVHRLKRSIKTLEMAFQVTSVVGSAAAGLTGGGVGLLAALGFGLLGTAAASTAAETLAKLTTSNSIVSLYDFDGSVTQKWRP